MGKRHRKGKFLFQDHTNRWPCWDLNTGVSASDFGVGALSYFVHRRWIPSREGVMNPVWDMQIDFQQAVVMWV